MRIFLNFLWFITGNISVSLEFSQIITITVVVKVSVSKFSSNFNAICCVLSVGISTPLLFAYLSSLQTISFHRNWMFFVFFLIIFTSKYFEGKRNSNALKMAKNLQSNESISQKFLNLRQANIKNSKEMNEKWKKKKKPSKDRIKINVSAWYACKMK